MRALYYQAYNLARYSLDENLKNSQRSTKQKAVVMDIDETLLNNSPFEGKMILSGISYTPAGWKEWLNKCSAEPLPGCLEFLNYAKSKKVEIFYISNRSVSEMDSTLKNFTKFHFPCADKEHMLFKADKDPSKESRRRHLIDINYEIVLLCGDNLGDVSAAFDNRLLDAKMDSVDKYKAEFGKRFMIIPNPMYGDWDKHFYKDKKLDDAGRDSARKANVIGF
jgi:5'-nucleotidase (lipoprotein e(P4) family)